MNRVNNSIKEYKNEWVKVISSGMVDLSRNSWGTDLQQDMIGSADQECYRLL